MVPAQEKLMENEKARVRGKGNLKLGSAHIVTNGISPKTAIFPIADPSKAKKQKYNSRTRNDCNKRSKYVKSSCGLKELMNLIKGAKI